MNTTIINQPLSVTTKRRIFNYPRIVFLPEGKYIVALSIPDPGDETLGIRLAVKNYFDGDYHPLGYIGYGRYPPSIDSLDEDSFDDPMKL